MGTLQMKDLEISKLYLKTMLEICEKLNIRNDRGDDYREFAAEVGMSFEDIQSFDRPRIYNATGEVFNWWICKERVTVEILRKKLNNIGRHDILEIIDKDPKVLQAMIENQQMNNFDVNNLHARTMLEMCKKLNIRKAIGGDYRRFAAEVGMLNHEIQRLSERYMDNSADEIFTWWESKEKVTVGKLEKILEKMKRYDILEILDNDPNGQAHNVNAVYEGGTDTADNETNQHPDLTESVNIAPQAINREDVNAIHEGGTDTADAGPELEMQNTQRIAGSSNAKQCTDDITQLSTQNVPVNITRRNPTEQGFTDSRSNPKESNQDLGANSLDLVNIIEFEKEIVKHFKEKMGKYESMAEDPPVGTNLARVMDATVGFGSFVGITSALVSAFVFTSAATAVTAGSAAAPAALASVMIGKYVIKIIRRKGCTDVIKATEDFTRDTLACIVDQTGKELSRIFEYQLSMLKNPGAARKMAKSAVDLMLNFGKKDVEFSSNTLLRNVLEGSKGVTKHELETKSGEKWHTPRVFFMPGLRKVVTDFDENRKAKIYKFEYLEKKGVKTQKYGFRGELLMRAGGDGSGAGAGDSSDGGRGGDGGGVNGNGENAENPSHGTFNNDGKFVISDIDDNYDIKYKGETKYQPHHCLLNENDLKQFSQDIKTQSATPKPSFARFAAELYNLPGNHLVKPVYRSRSSVNESLDLSEADLSGSNFTAADFRGYNLRGCDLQESIFDEAIFNHASLFNCKTKALLARRCTGLKQAEWSHCQEENAE